jgi:hypothetical protein
MKKGTNKEYAYCPSCIYGVIYQWTFGYKTLRRKIGCLKHNISKNDKHDCKHYKFKVG